MASQPKQRTPLSDKEELSLLFTRIGSALVSCQLVERSLAQILNEILPRKTPDSDAEDVRRKKRSTFKDKIQQLERRNSALKGLSKEHDEFREIRNEFVHGILDANGANPFTHEGRMACYMLAGEVQAQASAIMHVYGKLFEEYYTAHGLTWPSHLRSQ